MARHRKRLPAWVLGFLIAAVVFAGLLVAFALLGFGDDPVVGSLAAIAG